MKSKGADCPSFIRILVIKKEWVKNMNIKKTYRDRYIKELALRLNIAQIQALVEDFTHHVTITAEYFEMLKLPVDDRIIEDIVLDLKLHEIIEVMMIDGFTFNEEHLRQLDR